MYGLIICTLGHYKNYSFTEENSRVKRKCNIGNNIRDILEFMNWIIIFQPMKMKNYTCVSKILK